MKKSNGPFVAGALVALVALVGACSDGGHAPHGAGEMDDAHDEDAHGDDEHGDDEHDVVELTAAQAEAAGLRVATAAPGELLRLLMLPAVVAADADGVTHINPKAPGIVRSIHAQLGQDVAAGELLCLIDSVDLGNSVAAFVRARAMVEAAETTLRREGELYQGRLEAAERVLDGAVEVSRKIYEREEELQAQAVSTIRPLLEAERTLRAAELEKERELTDLRAERDARLLALEVELTERRILEDSARNALGALGVAPERLAELEPGSPLLSGAYEIRAARGGIVAGRHITTGEYVDSQTKLFTLEDLSRVWIVASAFEEQLQSVRTGQEARVHLDAFPGRVFEGVVTLVGHEVDPRSRALGVRVELENPTLAGWPEPYPLRPGMFGSVDLVVARERARVVLPEDAIVHEDDGDYVFVRVAPGRFERRAVELGPPSGEAVEVLAGVEPGDDVAVAGTFHLKSALREGELGGGHSH